MGVATRCECGLHGLKARAAHEGVRACDRVAARASPLGSPLPTTWRSRKTQSAQSEGFHEFHPQKAMDPLSLTASLIAIIGAATTVAKSLEDLRTTLRDASNDLFSLINEISDLRIVLDAIAVVLKEWQDGQNPWPSTDMGLSHILASADRKLLELNNLVLSCLVNPNSTSLIQPARLKWLRERKRIKECRKGIRDRKQDLTTLLGAYNL
jgi:hypothetical protein